MFEQTLLPAAERGPQGASFAVSLSVQALLVGTAIVVPLFFVESLPLVKLSRLVISPPAPRAIPLVAVPASVARQWMPSTRKVYFPTRSSNASQTAVATDVPSVFDTLTSEAPTIGSYDGIRGAAPVAQFTPAPPPPAPPKPVAKPEVPPQPTGPVPIGGDVQMAKLVKRVMPVYPPLARQARIQGTVRLTGIISKEGKIINLQVESGHPLLVNAAVDAVRQWLYHPTLLNGKPVEVIAPIDVNFTLSN
jgi:protein TonB